MLPAVSHDESDRQDSSSVQSRHLAPTFDDRILSEKTEASSSMAASADTEISLQACAANATSCVAVAALFASLELGSQTSLIDSIIEATNGSKLLSGGTCSGCSAAFSANFAEERNSEGFAAPAMGETGTAAVLLNRLRSLEAVLIIARAQGWEAQLCCSCCFDKSQQSVGQKRIGQRPSPV